MDYIVLDLETANPDYASICQIGLVIVRAGVVADSISVLKNPDDYFDPWNIAIHGIEPGHVAGAPRFNEVYRVIERYLDDRVVVHHGPFDRVALQRACTRYGLQLCAARWLDNQRVVRRTWVEFAQSGYALDKLAKYFGIDFNHHDALEDARVTEIIFRRALTESGLSPAEWIDRAHARISPKVRIERAGAAGGVFAGERIVFTGTLQVPRREAANAAQAAGFDVEDTVSKHTTMLCVGIQDRDRIAGYEKSAKHRKAEKMAAGGHKIAIISEADFWELIRLAE